MIKVHRIKEIAGFHGVYGHVCPICGSILSSSSEPDMLPEFSECTCSYPINKKTSAPTQQEDYTISRCFGKQNCFAVSRNKHPRFSAIYDGENLRWPDYIDDCSDSKRQKAERDTLQYIHQHVSDKPAIYFLQHIGADRKPHTLFSGTKDECAHYCDERKLDINKMSLINEYDI